MNEWFVNLIRISASASLSMLILVMTLRLLKEKLQFKTQYYLWVLCLLSFIMPIWLTIPIQIVVPYQVTGMGQSVSVLEGEGTKQENLPMKTMAKVEDVVHNNTVVEKASPTIETPSFNENPTPIVIKPMKKSIESLVRLEYLWGLGGLIYGLYQVYHYQIFKKKLMKKCIAVVDQEVLNTYSNVAALVGISEKPQLKTCQRDLSPMILGLRKPVLVVPYLEEISCEELKIILTHELIHLKRRDLWIKWGGVFISAVHWFNPLVFYMVRQINEIGEMSCDEEVVDYLGEAKRKEYISTILNVAMMSKSINKGGVLGMANSKKKLKKRCSHILSPITKKKGSRALASTLGLICVLTTSILAGCDVKEAEINSKQKTQDTVMESINTTDVMNQKFVSDGSVSSSDNGFKVYKEEENGKVPIFEFKDALYQGTVTEKKLIASQYDKSKNLQSLYIELETEEGLKSYIINTMNKKPVKVVSSDIAQVGTNGYVELGSMIALDLFGEKEIERQKITYELTQVEGVEWWPKRQQLSADFVIKFDDDLGEVKGNVQYNVTANKYDVKYYEASNEEAIVDAILVKTGFKLTSEEETIYSKLLEDFSIEFAKTIKPTQMVKLHVNAIIRGDAKVYKNTGDREGYEYKYPQSLEMLEERLEKSVDILEEDRFEEYVAWEGDDVYESAGTIWYKEEVIDGSSYDIGVELLKRIDEHWRVSTLILR